MDAAPQGRLISVKRGLLRHPAVVGAGAAALVALLGLNAVAFLRGLESPWLLGGVIVADMLVVGAGILLAARFGVALEESETRLAAIVDSAMDAVITVDGRQEIVLFNRAEIGR